jgi:hypothetical protein
LACCALVACGGSTGTPSSTGGAPGSGTGGATATGGSTGFGGATTGTGGSFTGTGGSFTGTGGFGTGGIFGTGGVTTGTGGFGTGGFGTGGSGTGGSGLGGSGAVGSGGSAGGATGGGGSGACNAVFCDDFDASTTLGAAWTADKGVAANVVEVVSTMAHSLPNSVHMHFTTASGATFIHESMGFPAPMNTVWGRVWFYVMNDPTSNGHDVYIEAADVLATNTGVRPLNTQGGKMAINVDPGLNGGEDGATSTMAIPRGVWTCFEWSIIAPTTGSGSVTLYMGGTQLATLAKTKVPALMYQRVGYEHYGADSAAGDMWIDDYAVGTTRINCN